MPRCPAHRPLPAGDERLQLLYALHQRHPDSLRAIAVTGSSRLDIPDADAFDEFFTKPVDLDRLTQSIHAARTNLLKNV